MIVLSLAALGTCQSTAIAEQQNGPEHALKQAREMASKYSRHIFVRGRYETILDFSSQPPVPGPRAQILLQDGFGLALEIGEAGLRPAEEHLKLHNRLVLVEGRLKANCQLAPSGYYGSFRMNCLEEIRSIKALTENHN